MARSAAIELTPRQQDLVKRLVQSGRFGDVEDVLTAGLELLDRRETQASDFISDIENEIEKGLQSGKATPMETAEDLLASFRDAR